METQWRKLTSLKYIDIVCGSPILIDDIDAATFWVNVLHVKDSGGKYAFKELAEFVLRTLSLPLAKATVERVFSIMNFVKSKSRNRMQISTLEAIIRIQLY